MLAVPISRRRKESESPQITRVGTSTSGASSNADAEPQPVRSAARYQLSIPLVAPGWDQLSAYLRSSSVLKVPGLLVRFRAAFNNAQSLSRRAASGTKGAWKSSA